MKFSELVDHAIQCIKTFNPVVNTIDSHADTFLTKYKDAYEKVFIKQVFYGCVRYEEFLKVFSRVFFELHPGQTNRNDAVLYNIFAYLAYFRLEELQAQDFRKLVTSQEAIKMHVFLQFAFDAEKLRSHLRDPWMAIYDFTYIDDKIIGGVEKHLPSVAEIIRFVEKRATGKVVSHLSTLGQTMGAQTNEDRMTDAARSVRSAFSASQSQGTRPRAQSAASGFNGDEEVKPVTQVIPFNLTKPKPKMIPVPDVIKREVKASLIPRNQNRKSLADIEKEKQERRAGITNAIRNEYESGSQQKFALATEGLVSIQKNDKVKQEAEKVLINGLKFQGPKPRMMPDFSKHQADVKLNAAALKREKHLIDLSEREEAKKMADMEMGLKDASEFIRWQREMDHKDDIERIEYVQKKKIEMEMSRVQAIAAKEDAEEENHKLAVGIRHDMEHNLEIREKGIQQKILENKAVIQQVHIQHDNTAAAKVAKKDANREIRDQIAKDLEEAAKRLADERAAEQAKKEELIRQLRELEKIPIQRSQGFDPTEAAQHGLLCEMSVAELRERIELQRRMVEQDNDFKREQNLAKKEREAQSLIEDAQKIQEHRVKRKTDADIRREEKVAQDKAKEEARIRGREKGLKEAYDKISNKKKTKKDEEDRLAKELKEIKLQRQYLNANAAMVEYKAWQELEKGKEREIRDRQNFKLAQQCGVNEILVSDQLVRATYAKDEVKEKLTYDKGFSERLTAQKKENEVLHKRTLEYKSGMHAKQKDYENALRENEGKRKPFNAKINEQSLGTATVAKQKREATYRMQQQTMDYNGMYEDSPGAAGMDDYEGMGFEDMEGDMQDDIESKMRMEAS